MPKSHRELVSHKLRDIILPNFSCRLSSSFSRDLSAYAYPVVSANHKL
jgi:hypothetical protein